MTTLNLNSLKQLRDRTNISMAECKKALLETNNDIETAIDRLKQWGALKSQAKASSIATEGIVWASVDHTWNIGVISEINSQTDFTSKSEEFNQLAKNWMEHLICLDDLIPARETEINAKREALIAKTGENIVFRRYRTFAFEGSVHHHITPYNHPGAKLASMVVFELPKMELRSSDAFKELADEVAMQVAAMNPTYVKRDDVSKEDLARQETIFKGQLAEEKKPESSWAKIIEGKFAKWFKEVCLLEQVSIKDNKKTIKQMIDEVEAGIGIVEFGRYELGAGIEKRTEDLGDEVNKLIGEVK